MCIMEVRPGQRTSTIAQAMAHNISTIERDLDLFKPLLKARNEDDLLATIEAGHAAMKVAYERFLECFAESIQNELAAGHDHECDDLDHGNERVHVGHADGDLILDAEDVVAAEHVDGHVNHVIHDHMVVSAHRAEKYETR